MSTGRAFHLPIPVGFESLNPVADLTDRVGREGPLFAIRLWQHRQRTGAVVAGENAAGILERLAGWTRKRGALAAALVATGIVEQTAKGLRIVDPFELGSVEWMGGRFDDVAVEPEVAGLAPDERARKYEAARKRITRKKGLTDQEREAALESLRVQFGVGRKADNQDTNRTEPDMSAGQTGHEPDTNRTRTGHEPPSQDKERAYTPATGPLPVPVPVALSEELTPTPSDAVEKPTPPAKPDPTEAAVTEVLEHWRDRVWVPTDGDPKVNIEGPKSEGRRKLIRPLLREGWTVDRLKRVVDGAASDDWLMGRAPGAKQGGWTEVENVFRRSRLDAREKAATAPAPVRRRDNGPTPPGAFDALWGDPNGTEGVHP